MSKSSGSREKHGLALKVSSRWVAEYVARMRIMQPKEITTLTHKHSLQHECLIVGLSHHHVHPVWMQRFRRR